MTNLNKDHIVFVTNIPTPYRNHLFIRLEKLFLEYSIEFEVMYMARTENNRFWQYGSGGLGYKYKFYNGLHLYIRRMPIHFNFRMVIDILYKKPKFLVLGGSWNSPTVIAVIILSPIFLRNSRILLWSEINDSSFQIQGGFIGFLRSKILGSVNEYIVPGVVAKETIKRLVENGKDKCFHMLPNLVDESIYNRTYQKFVISDIDNFFVDKVDKKERIFICVARLDESTKGLLRFLESVKDILLSHNIKLLIAGEGPDRLRIEKWLNNNEINNVFLLGNQSQENVAKLLALSDVFVLPSIRDKNPLSVIEALWSGLPLLVSERIGNLPEVLGKNGWSFDPVNRQDVRDKFILALSASDMSIREMGRNSQEIALTRYSTECTTANFVNELIGEDYANRY